jgi:hypothetical protein
MPPHAEGAGCGGCPGPFHDLCNDDLVTTLTSELTADFLSAVRVACLTCWKASNPPPAASYIYLMEDYRHDVSLQAHRQATVAALAEGYGYEGSLNDLQYAAHREAYAAGDDSQLEAMLRHVHPAAG